MSLALARKYRPTRFADVAVQSHVAATLKGAIARGRVAHGYLLCGPRGVGKTTLARVLAMALNCERRVGPGTGASAPDERLGTSDEAATAGEPCGQCASCKRIWSGAASLDVVEIDAASNRGVDDARELRERAMYAPSGDDRYKVYIVDEAHMLTREAWNALLKILEEPPPRVVFVFATTEPQKIAQSAAPVLSRLQRFDFKRIGPAEVRERLAHVLGEEGVEADVDALTMIARAADGSMRDALSLTDQVLSMGEGHITVERVRDALGLVPEDEWLALLDIVAERRAADVFPAVSRLADAGVDFGQFLTGLADMLRAQLAIELGGSAADVSEHARRALESRKGKLSAADLLRMLSALTELEPRFRKSGQQQLLLETMLVRFALLDRSVDLERVLRALGSSGGAPSGGAPSGGGRSGARPPVAEPRESARAAEPRESARAAEPRDGARATHLPATEMRSSSGASAVAAPAPARSAAPAPVRSAAALPALDVNQLTERWDELVERMRQGGKTLLATALAHSVPQAVTARGDVVVRLEEANDFFAQAIESNRLELLGILRDWFTGVERLQLVRDESGAAAPKRMTDEMIRAERLGALRKRDPVLGAAIDALDLDVVD
jgi:DNA polymerase-3 subunit gamma/tau